MTASSSNPVAIRLRVPPPRMYHFTGALPGLYRAGFEQRDLERRLETRMERRIVARKATRVEWRAWQHWLRVRYSPRAHRHAHNDGLRVRAYADLTFAISAAETREIFRVSMRPVVDLNRRMAAAFASLAPVMRRATEQTRAAIADCSSWRLAHEIEARRRLELHFELGG